jgi:hypothetical protein
MPDIYPSGTRWFPEGFLFSAFARDGRNRAEPEGDSYKTVTAADYPVPNPTREPEAYLRWCVPNDELRGYREDCLESFLWRAKGLDMAAIARAVKVARQARDGHAGIGRDTRLARETVAEQEAAIARGLEGLRMIDAWYAKHVPGAPSPFRQRVQHVLRDLELSATAPRSELPHEFKVDPFLNAIRRDHPAVHWLIPGDTPGARPRDGYIDDLHRELQRLGIGRDFRKHLLQAVGLTDPRPKT